jgi:hypothetical protein
VASTQYMQGRRKYDRPQAMIFSDSENLLNGDVYGVEDENFIILTDDNRSEISVGLNRIENRNRMINGTMRSYHTVDKLTISTGWSMIPSRRASNFYQYTETGKGQVFGDQDGNPGEMYTTDGGAGGVDMYNWYESHPGPFWLFLCYDRFDNFAGDPMQFFKLAQYSQIVHVYFASFDYTVVKRGIYDFWNVNIGLDEV